MAGTESCVRGMARSRKFRRERTPDQQPCATLRLRFIAFRRDTSGFSGNQQEGRAVRAKNLQAFRIAQRSTLRRNRALIVQVDGECSRLSSLALTREDSQA